MTSQMMSQLVLPQAFFDRKPLITADGKALTLEDRLQMMEILHRFEWSSGALHQDAVFDLLTDDIVINHGMGYAQGKGAMVGLAIPTYGLRHLFANHVLFMDEQGRPCIVAHMLVIQVVSEQPLPTAFPAILDQGMNRFIFRYEDGQWKICEMIFEQHKIADYIGVPVAIQKSMAQTAIARNQDRSHE
ncbi:nuclear transport factor 2 family protein [Leptolyngbya sp. AN03gr2]|uniref:nuclear transport factor 2 family protein n=1 Tax=unclassified Leptolyngbya TaxID=2650499 RepID=UPI003D31222B